MTGDLDRLTTLREALDAVDSRILEVLNERARLVQQVAEHKRATGTPFYVPDREKSIIARLTACNRGPFPDAGIGPVMQEVISACLSLETGVRVAFLGPEGTFTHQAVKRQFGSSARSLPTGTIGGVFDEVSRREADYGVVPVENSTEGVVTHTLDSLVTSDLVIVAEVLVPIVHCLLARSGGALSDIERVYSHPQALGQCRQWLQDNLSRAVLLPAPSTAEAARIALRDSRAAAVASEAAGRLHELSILRSQIQDFTENYTRFLVVGRPGETPTRTDCDKTSIVMVLRDEPGILSRMLAPLSAAGVNLTKIESRPSRRQLWESVFFMDMDGHASEPGLATVLDDVAQACRMFKVLGSYPKVQGASHADRAVADDADTL